jgi:hypothetical protein
MAGVGVLRLAARPAKRLPPPLHPRPQTIVRAQRGGPSAQSVNQSAPEFLPVAGLPPRLGRRAEKLLRMGSMIRQDCDIGNTT